MRGNRKDREVFLERLTAPAHQSVFYLESNQWKKVSKFTSSITEAIADAI